MPMGWVRVFTQRGVIISGSFSTRWRTISKLVLPAPMITPARNHRVRIRSGRPERISPVSMRLARCLEADSRSPRPPR